jgi:DNA-binding transcriptional regulator GbsR (MarR family)
MFHADEKKVDRVNLQHKKKRRSQRKNMAHVEKNIYTGQLEYENQRWSREVPGY